MGVKERIEQLRTTETTERTRLENERKQRETKHQQDLKAARERQLPKVLQTRRRLFVELEAAGVIDIIGEAIFPDKVPEIITQAQAQRTQEKRRRAIERHNKSKTPQTHILLSRDDNKSFTQIMRESEEQRRSQTWKLYPADIRQEDDGTLDPTLNYSIANIRRGFHGENMNPDQYVQIAYSPDRILTIQGEEVTFQGKLNRQNANKEVLEYALAIALFKPQIIKPPEPAVPPHSHPTLRY